MLREAIDRLGYATARDVFSAEQVERLRRDVEAIFARPREPGDTAKNGVYPEVRLNAVARYPELQWLTSHGPLLSAMNDVVPGFVFLPETAIQAEGFGGWHRDTGAQEGAGHRFQWEHDYRMVQCAVYLQDAGEHGGGLEVLPQSHRHQDRFAGRGRLGAFLRRCETVTWRGYVVPHRAGDLVMFDYRIEHRASQPTVPTPAPLRKLALFMAISADNRHAKAYVDFLRTRPEYGYLRAHVSSP